MEVYVWDWSEKDPLQLVHTQVLANRERKDVLESFSPAQSIYNSWSNEWDLCEYFGLSDDNEDEDSLDEDHNGPDLRDNETAYAAYIAEHLQDLAPLPSHDSPLLMIPTSLPSTSLSIFWTICPLIMGLYILFHVEKYLWIMELGTIAWRCLVMLLAPTTPLCWTFMNQSLTLSRLFKLLVDLILISSIASLTITSQLRLAGYSKISSALTNFLSFNLASFSLIFSPGALLYMIFPGPSMCSDCCSRAAYLCNIGPYPSWGGSCISHCAALTQCLFKVFLGWYPNYCTNSTFQLHFQGWWLWCLCSPSCYDFVVPKRTCCSFVGWDCRSGWDCQSSCKGTPDHWIGMSWPLVNCDCSSHLFQYHWWNW